MQPKDTAAGRRTRLFPDANFIRREIPVCEVAARLGLRGDGRYFYCWREDHPKRDGRATVGIHVKSNSLRCFKCDAHNLSPIDVVADVCGISVGEALRWFGREYPEIPTRRLKLTTNARGVAQHVYRQYISHSWPGMNCDALALSPVWARFSHGARALAAAIVARAPRERNVCPVITCCYSEMQVWTGIGSRNTLAKAIRELSAAGLIVTSLAPTGRETAQGFATKQTLIRLTPFSARFRGFVQLGEEPGKANCNLYTVSKVIRRSRGNFDSPLASWKPASGQRVQ